jgi:hypothetical protein
MIQATETRIGNWIKYDQRYFKIHVISKELPSLDTDEFGIGVVSWNSIEPILLTSDILKKCVFKVNELSKYAYIGNFEIHKESEYYYYDACNGADRYLKYLHQLQNLFFSMEDRELNFKP